jgi:hypothetical protein
MRASFAHRGLDTRSLSVDGLEIGGIRLGLRLNCFGKTIRDVPRQVRPRCQPRSRPPRGFS